MVDLVITVNSQKNDASTQTSGDLSIINLSKIGIIAKTGFFGIIFALIFIIFIYVLYKMILNR